MNVSTVIPLFSAQVSLEFVDSSIIFWLKRKTLQRFDMNIILGNDSASVYKAR